MQEDDDEQCELKGFDAASSPSSPVVGQVEQGQHHGPVVHTDAPIASSGELSVGDIQLEEPPNPEETVVQIELETQANPLDTKAFVDQLLNKAKTRELEAAEAVRLAEERRVAAEQEEASAAIATPNIQQPADPNLGVRRRPPRIGAAEGKEMISPNQDEKPPATHAIIGFSSVEWLCFEADGSITLQVVRSGISDSKVTFSWETENNNIMPGSYIAQEGKITLEPNQNSAMIPIEILDNDTWNVESTQLVHIKEHPHSDPM